jgi:uncharacterized protein (TIGR03437 family)
MTKTFSKVLIGLFLASAPQAFAQSVTFTYGYSGLPIPIFSDAANIISVANVFVPRAVQIQKVTVQVQISYPNSGDLKLYLYSPQLTRTILLQNDCGVANVDTTFDDAAGSQWKSFCPVEAGRGPFQPDQPLSNFNSDYSSYGTWQLAVVNDQSNSRTGFLNTFNLTITGINETGPVTNAQATVNAASYTGAGTVAPGELISIYGVGLGPVTPLSAPSGTSLPLTLGGAQVSFNGVLAPIAYASQFRIDVQAPFSLSPGTNATVQVSNQSISGSPFQLNVVDTVPGVYTAGSAGLGYLSAVNQDGSLNGPQGLVTKPAPKGSYVTLYASGLGAINPPLKEGTVPPTTGVVSKVTGPTSVLIGGVQTTILFAGAAPGLPGVYQVNIQIPAGAASGSQEFVFYQNGKASQKGAYIAIQ